MKQESQENIIINIGNHIEAISALLNELKRQNNIPIDESQPADFYDKRINSSALMNMAKADDDTYKLLQVKKNTVPDNKYNIRFIPDNIIYKDTVTD